MLVILCLYHYAPKVHGLIMYLRYRLANCIHMSASNPDFDIVVRHATTVISSNVV